MNPNTTTKRLKRLLKKWRRKDRRTAKAWLPFPKVKPPAKLGARVVFGIFCLLFLGITALTFL